MDQYINDGGLTAWVNGVLAVDGVTGVSEIEPETAAGAVTLTGQHDSRKEVGKAIQVAESVEGLPCHRLRQRARER